jgi:hypothetical protein
MTAIARIHTPEGFAVAADGRMGYGTTIASDQVQKIVSLSHPCGVMSCAVSGAGKIGLYTFTQIARAAMSCIELNPINHVQHLTNLAEQIGRSAGRFPPPSSDPLVAKKAMLHLDGYFHGSPICGRLEFSHDALQGTKREVYIEDLTTGGARILGLREIYGKVCPREKVATLEHAIEVVKDVIRAHCSKEAKHVRPDLAKIIWPWGGHVHIATVRATDGFQWVSGFEPIARKQKN